MTGVSKHGSGTKRNPARYGGARTDGRPGFYLETSPESDRKGDGVTAGGRVGS